jgi:hypothetical protein
MGELTLVGRSSSHFTRLTRIFAIELEVPHGFRPVFDLTSLATAEYADNPALKIPSSSTSTVPSSGARTSAAI